MNPAEIIDQILERKRQLIRELKSQESFGQLARRAEQAPGPRGFRRSLQTGTPLAVIAELKKASPSKGLLREEFDPVDIATQYERAGATAISVLTEEHFFLGKPEYLWAVRQKVNLPLLRKDFLLDPVQIPESRLLGADAVLLIVAFLTPESLKIMYKAAKDFGLDALIEVHNEEELDIALQLAPDLVGINNRNLKTFQVDVETTFRLLPKIGASRTVVSESGISSHEEISRLARAGVHAVLVGESLMRSQQVGEKLRALLNG